MRRDNEAPAAPQPAEPEEPQTSVHGQTVGPLPATSSPPSVDAQTVGPPPATSNAPSGGAERTRAEASSREADDEPHATDLDSGGTP